MLQRINGYADASGASVKVVDASFPAPFAPGLEFSSPARGTWNIVHTTMLVPGSHQVYICAAGCLRGVVLTAAEAGAMNRFFGRLDLEGALTKTIVYNLNPRDNELMVTNAYNFNDGSVPGKMQYGAAWWFLDQKTGMENQLNALSALGLLSRFVGMLTDSRSFLSYPRHEYFRRILCNVLGSEIESGEIPVSELPFVGKMVEDISYNNARSYFNFKL